LIDKNNETVQYYIDIFPTIIPYKPFQLKYSYNLIEGILSRIEWQDNETLKEILRNLLFRNNDLTTYTGRESLYSFGRYLNYYTRAHIIIKQVGESVVTKPQAPQSIPSQNSCGAGLYIR